MRTDVCLNFNGNCEAAFRFYEQHLGGHIDSLMRHGESAQPGNQISAEWHDRVLHQR